jgi:hypothetical protein
MEKTYDRQGKANKVRSFGSDVVKSCVENNNGVCFITYDKQGDPIGGAFIVWDKRCAYYLLGGMDHEKGSNSAVTLALWKAICFSKEELGVPIFDFEGSLAPQLEQFFRRFGGEMHHYYRAIWSPKLLGIVKRVVERF